MEVEFWSTSFAAPTPPRAGSTLELRLQLELAPPRVLEWSSSTQSWSHAKQGLSSYIKHGLKVVLLRIIYSGSSLDAGPGPAERWVCVGRRRGCHARVRCATLTRCLHMDDTISELHVTDGSEHSFPGRGRCIQTFLTLPPLTAISRYEREKKAPLVR